MDIKAERRMWRILAVVTGIFALTFFAWCQSIFYETGDMTHQPLWAGIAGAFCLLTTITCLVAARILGMVAGIPEGARAFLWKLLIYSGSILGIVTIGVERLRTRHYLSISSNMKAVYVAGAFAIMAGAIAFVGERCVLHIANARTEKAAAKSV